MTVVADIGIDLGDYAGFFPGLVISVVVALILSGGVARRLGTPRVVAFLLLASLGAVLSATITPSREALLLHPAIATGGCDLSRVGPARLAEYVSVGTATLNVALFIPLGVAIGLLPHSRLKLGLVLGRWCCRSRSRRSSSSRRRWVERVRARTSSTTCSGWSWASVPGWPPGGSGGERSPRPAWRPSHRVASAPDGRELVPLRNTNSYGPPRGDHRHYSGAIWPVTVVCPRKLIGRAHIAASR